MQAPRSIVLGLKNSLPCPGVRNSVLLSLITLFVFILSPIEYAHRSCENTAPLNWIDLTNNPALFLTPTSLPEAFELQHPSRVNQVALHVLYNHIYTGQSNSPPSFEFLSSMDESAAELESMRSVDVYHTPQSAFVLINN